MHGDTRPAAVAGLFYPGVRVDLIHLVDELLEQVGVSIKLPRQPRAFVVPHAGLVYSGPVSAFVYRQILDWRDKANWHQVVILGPNHRVPLSGLAGVSESFWRTPLGDLPIALDLERSLLEHFEIPVRKDAHQLEHCVEVQLPFLQRALPAVQVLPLLVGVSEPELIGSLILELWKRPEVLVLISSDLSHYHSWETARELDAMTTLQIEGLKVGVKPEQACGCHALNGLLFAARRAGYEMRCLAQNTSGDTAGDKAKVVGYGAYVCY